MPSAIRILPSLLVHPLTGPRMHQDVTQGNDDVLGHARAGSLALVPVDRECQGPILQGLRYLL